MLKNDDYNVNSYQIIHFLNIQIWFSIIMYMMKTKYSLLIYQLN